jgi:tryptophan halogenase
VKIVIVGGGTAGWISALILQKETDHNITLIDSSSIGPLGVGESTTGLFGQVIRAYLSEEDFVEKCGLTPKLGTQFIGWSDKDFYSPLEGTFSAHDEFDYAFYYGLENSRLNDYSVFSLFASQDKINFNKTTTKEKFVSDRRYAYHLDTYKTIAYLKEKCVESGVQFIDSKVVDISLDKFRNVNQIYTEDSAIECDFVIDCSGFNRTVISAYNPNFVSYEKWMSVNTGLPFNLSWDEIEYKKPVTTSRALSCGWMWMIPTQHSIGCGIVYDNNFATQDEIVAEVNEILGVNIKIRKEIKFRSGRLDQSLCHNVASIGTCYSFLEPLQATSIHTTILQIERLVHLLENSITVDDYNLFCADVVDNYADFVSLHYQFKHINNEFWQSRIPREYTAEMIEKSKRQALTPYDYDINRGHYELVGHNLWSYILAGGHLVTHQRISYTEEQLNNIQLWENQIPEVLENSMTFTDFLGMYK